MIPYGYNYTTVQIWVNIGSGNGLLPVPCQATTSINDELGLTAAIEMNFSEIEVKNVISKMLAILFRFQKWIPCHSWGAKVYQIPHHPLPQVMIL